MNRSGLRPIGCVLGIVILLFFTLMLSGAGMNVVLATTYPNYGFDFVRSGHNAPTDLAQPGSVAGLLGWRGDGLDDTARVSVFEIGADGNSVLGMTTAGDNRTVITYDDYGFFQPNPEALTVNFRLKVDEYAESSGEDYFNVSLYNGAYHISLLWTDDGIYVRDVSGKDQLIVRVSDPAHPGLSRFADYTVKLRSGQIDLLINGKIQGSLDAIEASSESPRIGLVISKSVDSSANTKIELDHFFIHSKSPENALVYDDEKDASTHYLVLGEAVGNPTQKIGFNGFGGGWVGETYYDYTITDKSMNIDPKPKFGSGGNKPLRDSLHALHYNPVQAGAGSHYGHVAELEGTIDQIKIKPFSIYLYQEQGNASMNMVENEGQLLNVRNPERAALQWNDGAVGDNDDIAEYEISMQDEILSELDFHAVMTDKTLADDPQGTLEHYLEWRFVRPACALLQMNNYGDHDEILEQHRREAAGYRNPEEPLNSDSTLTTSDGDLGYFRIKQGCRLNRDMDFKYLHYRIDGAWAMEAIDVLNEPVAFNLSDNAQVYDAKEPDRPTVDSNLMIMSNSSSPTEGQGIGWWVPMGHVINLNDIVIRDRHTDEVLHTVNRKEAVTFNCDWRKNNWMRLAVNCRSKGLLAPGRRYVTGQTQARDVYETKRMLGYQIFGTPEEILTKVRFLISEVDSEPNAHLSLGAGSLRIKQN